MVDSKTFVQRMKRSSTKSAPEITLGEFEHKIVGDGSGVLSSHDDPFPRNEMLPPAETAAQSPFGERTNAGLVVSHLDNEIGLGTPSANVAGSTPRISSHQSSEITYHPDAHFQTLGDRPALACCGSQCRTGILNHAVWFLAADKAKGLAKDCIVCRISHRRYYRNDRLERAKGFLKRLQEVQAGRPFTFEYRGGEKMTDTLSMGDLEEAAIQRLSTLNRSLAPGNRHFERSDLIPWTAEADNVTGSSVRSDKEKPKRGFSPSNDDRPRTRSRQTSKPKDVLGLRSLPVRESGSPGLGNSSAQNSTQHRSHSFGEGAGRPDGSTPQPQLTSSVGISKTNTEPAGESDGPPAPMAKSPRAGRGPVLTEGNAERKSLPTPFRNEQKNTQTEDASSILAAAINRLSKLRKALQDAEPATLQAISVQGLQQELDRIHFSVRKALKWLQGTLGIDGRYDGLRDLLEEQQLPELLQDLKDRLEEVSGMNATSRAVKALNLSGFSAAVANLAEAVDDADVGMHFAEY